MKAEQLWSKTRVILAGGLVGSTLMAGYATEATPPTLDDMPGISSSILSTKETLQVTDEEQLRAYAGSFAKIVGASFNKSGNRAFWNQLAGLKDAPYDFLRQQLDVQVTREIDGTGQIDKWDTSIRYNEG